MNEVLKRSAEGQAVMTARQSASSSPTIIRSSASA